MLREFLAPSHSSLLLSLVLAGLAVLTILSAIIYARTASAYGDELAVSLVLAFWVIILPAVVVLLWQPHDWPEHLVTVMAPLAVIAGIHYFSGRSRFLWIIGILGIGLAVIFGDATAEAAQYRTGVVLGVLAAALSASIGGFCLGCVAMRWSGGRTLADAGER